MLGQVQFTRCLREFSIVTLRTLNLECSYVDMPSTYDVDFNLL